jgi:hypothetical protein
MCRMSDTRCRFRFLRPFGALAVAAVVGAAIIGAAHLAGAVDDRAPLPEGGALPSSGSTSQHSKPGAVSVAVAPVSVRYTFDAGIKTAITSVTGPAHPLRALGQNGGELSLVRQGAGLAVAYPQRCTLGHDRKCPRAILEGIRDDSLNPGTRPLTYGASVLMTQADLADGANVFQKGYSVGGVSQFKLQVDHRLGHPSCVIAGQSRHIYRAEPELDVADGTWHNLACARTATALTITVDGVLRATVPVPATVSIANSEPLRVGGKGANKGNDQFAGQIDNVYLTID